LISNITSVLNLLIILSILVVVHEYGHFLFARFFKTRVDEFSLFFGKVLVRLGKRGDTVYNIRALPFGGFVKIAGMEADDISGGRPLLEAIRDPNFKRGGVEDLIAQLNEDVEAGIEVDNISPEVRELLRVSVGPDGRLDPERRADLEMKQASPQVTEDERKLIQRVLVADTTAGDPTLYNSKPIYQRALIIFGGPLFSLLFGYIVFCLVFMLSGAPRMSNRIFVVAKDGPAFAAGLKKGDQIVSIDGVPTPNGDKLIEIIHKSAGKRLSMQVRRDNQTLTLAVTPKLDEVSNEVGEKMKAGKIGIAPDREFERLGPVAAVVEGTTFTRDYMVNLARMIFSKHVRENVIGPVGMVQVSKELQKSGFVALASMAAMFSLSLGVMNLLPIPILDGGHLLLLGVEKIRRRRPTPREIYRAQLVGVAILAVIVCLVMYNDIARLITGRGFQ
jgi:regulator of sigma E protease